MRQLLSDEQEKTLLCSVADVVALEWSFSEESNGHRFIGEGVFVLVSRMTTGYYAGIDAQLYGDYSKSRRCKSLDEAIGFVVRQLARLRHRQLNEWGNRRG